jgi:hypothetical protein
MSLVSKFRWGDVHGEGFINKTDAARVLEEDWITAADFLVDVIHDAQNLYDEVLEKMSVTPCLVAEALGHGGEDDQ